MASKFFLAAVVILLLGIAIPKLTVRDTVPVEPQLAACAARVVALFHDNPLERFALALGAHRIVDADAIGGIVVESFTAFRIPLAVLRGESELRLGTICNEEGEPSSIRIMPPTNLVDGTVIAGLGRLHASPVADGVKSFRSDTFGIAFAYPSDYLLFENRGEGAGGIEYYVLTVAPEASYRAALRYIGATEWPPAIHLSFYREPDTSISLETWIRTQPQSNFDPALPPGNTLRPVTVAGESALAYRVSGLYENDYVALRHGEWVVLTSAAYLDDPEKTMRDFETILESIELESE